MHEFRNSLAAGKSGEAAVVNALRAEGWSIEVADTQIDRRLGVDAIARWGATTERLLQIKTDYRAAETGNVFLETLSVDKTLAPSGLEATEATRVIYYFPHLGEAWVFDSEELWALLGSWVNDYPERKVENDGYFTHGVAVPLGTVKQHACHVVRVAAEA